MKSAPQAEISTESGSSCHRISCRGLWRWSWLFVAISEVAIPVHINPLSVPALGLGFATP